MPQAADGMRIDPPVSVPTAARHMPSTIDTAAPPLDPPGDRDGSCGLRTAPNAVSSLVVPKANSCRLVLPTTMAPARRRLATTGASRSGRRGGAADPDVVGVPARSTGALGAPGMPGRAAR